MMTTLISIIIGLIFAGCSILTIGWGVHISMVKGENIPQGWASFKKFKREFDKYNWQWDGFWNNSLFNYSQGGYLHASIFKFDHKGMKMTDPISFLLSCLYIRKYIRTQIKPYRKDMVKW
jgi:hypothetical protein